MSTKAQKFAQERNWSKAQIMGAVSNLKRIKRVLTEEEKFVADNLLADYELLISTWDYKYQQAKEENL